VGRASDDSGRPRWRRLLGLFNREHDTNPAPPSGPAPAGAGGPDPGRVLPGRTSAPVAAAESAAPGGATGTPTAKKDDALQQTSASATLPADEAGPAPSANPPRRRLFDFLRRDDD
jgi:hypothetical protein